MCPNCRAFIEISDRVCPYCDAQLGPRAIDMRASQLASSLLPRANLTSGIILSINVAFFLIEMIVNSQLVRQSLFSGFADMNINTLVLLGCKLPHGEWWRLITAGFLHAGFIHLAMNSYGLFILVSEVEQFYGTSRFIVAYIVSIFTGFLLSALWSPGVPSLGASTAVFGMIGIMLAMGVRRRSDPLVQAVRAHYTQYVIFGLLYSLLGRIDMAAHIGGLIGGFLVGAIAGLPGLPNSPRENLWRVIAGVAIAITVYAFFLDFQSYRSLLSQL
jgi:rhomboid protease GluP